MEGFDAESAFGGRPAEQAGGINNDLLIHGNFIAFQKTSLYT